MRVEVSHILILRSAMARRKPRYEAVNGEARGPKLRRLRWRRGGFGHWGGCDVSLRDAEPMDGGIGVGVSSVVHGGNGGEAGSTRPARRRRRSTMTPCADSSSMTPSGASPTRTHMSPSKLVARSELRNGSSSSAGKCHQAPMIRSVTGANIPGKQKPGSSTNP